MIPEEIKMELKEFFFAYWKPITGVILAIIALISLIFLPRDNKIEQLAEKGILDLTGVDIDFSKENPSSPPQTIFPKGANGIKGPM